MNTTTLEIALRIAGMMLIGLVIANFVAAKRWDYSGSLVGVRTIVRQIFHVHSAYIISIIAGLALVCLGWPCVLLEGGFARAFCGFFTAFWLSRVVVQLFYYDPELRRADRCWDIFFLGVFLTLSIIFGLATYYS